mmetsp:Transcript_79360/g.128587  ORF Transcript_79360/g.128587 Transcript_79360/m.128587 type:complete len:549 (-) Transcript_79360:617-2263(-)|eukprot:CAMPEP_0179429838 /NCGR_PEP_ID=MMETSP0799-20121207/15115_1 /TAXON_ID=46947 /ORGANISM="Geminigera cryophila, Strain CCMP2564" /LENGTH=548 /DNA_ID=CAMNT_0021205943 /DNA_START=225 /DNA_END=1871 /DNA_ORIENTATION=+
MGKSKAPTLSHDEPIDSVEVVGQHALKMGWLEKEAEESMMGGWSKRFVVLTGWDGTESHLFYYRSESDTQASGILFLSEMEIEDVQDPKALTLQGSQRRFRFRCESADLCRSWRVAIQEAKKNGDHECRAGEACLAWRRDKHAKTCQHCKRIFSVTIGKHHCRCCGRIFCNECTKAEKICLEPYTKAVRCCNTCNSKQTTLIAKHLEMQQRAKVFVSRYLELLESGSSFTDPDRPDVARRMALDKADGLSLQFRSLIITESFDVDAVADALGSKAVSGSISFASNLKAMTLRGFTSVRGAKLDKQHVVKAFEPEQAKQNINAAGKAVGTFAVSAGGAAVGVAGGAFQATSALAISLGNTVGGPRTFHVHVKDFIGVSDCASNPTMIKRLKEKAPLAFMLAFRDVRDFGSERDIIQVCCSEDEKTAWFNALTELRLLAQDAGTDLLVFKKEQEENNKKITDNMKKRKESRRSKAEEEYKSQTLRETKTDMSPSLSPDQAPHSTTAASSSSTAVTGQLKAPTLRERMLWSSTIRSNTSATPTVGSTASDV